jgi:hypothetical protein
MVENQISEVHRRLRGRRMERFRKVFWLGRLWAYLDAEVRVVLIGMLIMIVISAAILVANLID